MPFSDREISIQDASIIELYEFMYRSNTYRYTSANEEQIYLDNIYKPIPLDRTDIEEAKEVSQSDITIEMGIVDDSPPEKVSRLNVQHQLSAKLFVTIRQKHSGDADEDVQEYWTGEVINIALRGPITYFDCVPRQNSGEQKMLRWKWQRLCNAYLYDGIGCPVPREAFAVNVTITNIAGRFVTVSDITGFAVDWFNGGYSETDDAEQETRDIIARNGSILELNAPYDAQLYKIGDALIIYAGCDHLFATCIAKFGLHTRGGKDFAGHPTTPDDNLLQSGVTGAGE
jgi:uncharacterized phage protein (TIGR02218 family)